MRIAREAVSRGDGAQAIARLLAEQMRDVSARNAAVGLNLMVTCIPRDLDPDSIGMVILGPPQPRTATFLSITADRQELWFTPTVVSEGMIMTGGEITTDPDRFSNNPPHPPR